MDRLSPLAALAPPLRPRARRGLLRGLLGAYADWQSRRRLAGLDDHRLGDLGLTREEALREAARPAWRDAWSVPAHWLR